MITEIYEDEGHGRMDRRSKGRHVCAPPLDFVNI